VKANNNRPKGNRRTEVATGQDVFPGQADLAIYLLPLEFTDLGEQWLAATATTMWFQACLSRLRLTFGGKLLTSPDFNTLKC